ncbi:MAG: universal stress protein [Bacteroidales bacterium]|nr:universal stress protein [Bacteroidales bacterium]
MKSNKNNIKILVPVPLSPDFTIALSQALQFNKAYRTEIILMHVVPDNLSGRIKHTNRVRRSNYEASFNLRCLAMNFFKGEIPDNVSLKVVNGPLIPTILKEASDMKCDLIIIKKSEKTKGYLNFMRTENADKLISEAVRPVITIPGNGTDGKIRDILLPVDIFKKTTTKVAWAISLAKRFNARLHVVSVLNMDIKPEDSMSYKKCKQMEYEIRKEGLEVDTAMLRSEKKSMADSVLDYSAKIRSDLIIIMTHQETSLIDNYLGSFATDIIHRSKVPVFSVVPGKEEVLSGFFSTISASANK